MIEVFKKKFDQRHRIAGQIKKEGKRIIGCFYGSGPQELIHSAGGVQGQILEGRG